MRNTLCLRVNGLAFAVIFRWLSHINLGTILSITRRSYRCGKPSQLIQRLRFWCGRVNLVKLPGRALQPLLHLFASGFYHHKGVGIEIEIGGIAEGEWPFSPQRNWPVVVTPADFKRRGGREHRQLREVRVALNKALRYKLFAPCSPPTAWVVLHQCQEAAHRRGFPHRLANELAGRVAIVLQYLHQTRHLRLPVPFSRRIVDGRASAFEVVTLTPPLSVIQHQIHHPRGDRPTSPA